MPFTKVIFKVFLEEISFSKSIFDFWRNLEMSVFSLNGNMHDVDASFYLFMALFM